MAVQGAEMNLFAAQPQEMVRQQDPTRDAVGAQVAGDFLVFGPEDHK